MFPNYTQRNCHVLSIIPVIVTARSMLLTDWSIIMNKVNVVYQSDCDIRVRYNNV